MTLVEGVFFSHRSSTPTAHKTFLSFPSHIFVPSLMSRLSLLVFCSGELGPFISPFCFLFCILPFALLSPFLLSSLFAQERFSTLLARARTIRFSSSFFCFLFTSAFFRSSHNPSSPPIGLQPTGAGPRHHLWKIRRSEGTFSATPVPPCWRPKQ